ncbi:MAG: hypothetical protein V1876_00080 [Candidatus Peregrinibacteria bacterium]
MKHRWKIVLLLTLLVCGVGAAGAGLLWHGFGQRQTGTDQAALQKEPGIAAPNRDEALSIVNGTMRDFAQGLVKKDFTDFYGTFSSLWKKQTTSSAIAQAFNGFVPFGREVQKSVTSGPPFFNAPPSVGEKNVLTLQGYYRIEATKMLFNLQYVREGDAWKLFGVNLEVK